MAEFNQSLWAPWRMEYIAAPKDQQPDGCFLCRYAAHPEQDAANHVIWRGRHCMTLFNRFPYSNGHLMVVPYSHVGLLESLGESTMTELMTQLRDAQRLLRETVNAQGFNVGMNLGKCAGAGVPDHLHAHIVPRWESDTNFMSVVGAARVIPQSIEDLLEKMRAATAKLGLQPIRS